MARGTASPAAHRPPGRACLPSRALVAPKGALPPQSGTLANGRAQAPLPEMSPSVQDHSSLTHDQVPKGCIPRSNTPRGMRSQTGAGSPASASSTGGRLLCEGPASVEALPVRRLRLPRNRVSAWPLSWAPPQDTRAGEGRGGVHFMSVNFLSLPQG